ncbi:hypothetical protein [Geotalea sp. SG265]|uniref:hypothetical protein n=1 Tax=Geotalea sp. SG265 TaxID=2922867 RepID=UPI001FB00A7C|nr:hypothetical protein [Geotalea sp. SG265]
MDTVKRLIFTTAALVALSGLALSAEENEYIIDEPGAAVKGHSGSGAGGAVIYRSYSSSGPGGVTVFRSYSSAGAGGAVIYRSYSSGGAGGAAEESGSGAGGATYRSYSSGGTGGSTHGSYGIDVDTRTGGSYPGVSPDTTTGTDTSQGMGGITGGRSGSYKFGIGGKGTGGTMGTYSSATGR